MALFTPIITGDQKLDRIQANISNAFNESSAPNVYVVNTVSYTVASDTNFLVIPARSLGVSTINIGLPDAVDNPGIYFDWKRIDTSTSTLSFYCIAKNRQGIQQLVENGTVYTTAVSLAYGRFISDGNNWWLV